MTGTVTEDQNGKAVVTVQTTLLMKWALGVLGALSVAAVTGAVVLMLDYRSLRSNWPDVKETVRKNSEYRLKGDRVTPSDMEGVQKSFRNNLENQNTMISEFLNATRETNQLLSKQGNTLARIDARLESVEKEQERARQEREDIKKGN